MAYEDTDSESPDLAGPAPTPSEMQDTDVTADMSPADEVCIPLAALAQPDDQQRMNNPEEGDPVDWRSTGNITRIVGQNAYVRPTAINEQPIQGADGSKSDEQEETDLQGMAAKMPPPQ